MFTTLASLALVMVPPAPALVRPPCEVQLRTIREAQRTLRTLHRSETSLRRRHRHGAPVERLLHPIANQARALEALLDAQERAYIRCIEDQLDEQPRPARALRGV